MERSENTYSTCKPWRNVSETRRHRARNSGPRGGPGPVSSRFCLPFPGEMEPNQLSRTSEMWALLSASAARPALTTSRSLASMALCERYAGATGALAAALPFPVSPHHAALSVALGRPACSAGIRLPAHPDLPSPQLHLAADLRCSVLTHSLRTLNSAVTPPPSASVCKPGKLPGRSCRQ